MTVYKNKIKICRIDTFKVKVKVIRSCPILCNSMDCTVLYMNSTDQNTRVGSLSFRQGIFLNQGLNLGLLYCRQIS